GAAAGPQNTPSRFADGGDLENTGVASLLSYTDVDSVIAFVNSSDPLTAVGKGVMDAGGQEIAGTRVFVSFQLPPLFGYQPWDPVRGYVLYAGDANPSSPIFKHNQVFDSADFPDLLQSLWSVTGNSGDPAAKGATGSQKIPGANQNPAVVEQSLTTQANAWFGVAGGRAVTLLWCYTNPVQAWVGLLQPDVQSLLQGPDFTTFPNFSADSSHLTVQQINLLASLTAWCVGNAGNGPAFVDLFGG
ncbi:MAG TPA: hypothetical protein VEG34_13780, partial [Thermoanaerobaculia bacterium]|nr:hypothetical protein [Thermoanaerobaculia bacterium]